MCRLTERIKTRPEHWQKWTAGSWRLWLWPDPRMKPRFCSLLAALAFVRFLEYAEQNRLKTRGFCAAGSVRIMWGGTLHFFENLKTPSRQSTSTQHPNRKSVLNPKMLSEMSSRNLLYSSTFQPTTQTTKIPFPLQKPLQNPYI